MANEVTTASLSNQFRRHYSDQLLAVAEDTVVLEQFAKKATIDKKLGATTARFFRRVAASSANVQTLVENTPISAYTALTYTPVDVDLVQIGEAMRYTDVATWTALLDILDDGVTLMGEDAALKADDVVWSVLAHATTGATKRYTGVTQTFAGISALTGTTGKFVATDGLHAVTSLKIAKAPKIGGEYVGIVGPQVSDDLRQDTRWLSAAQYSNVKALYRGEIGTLDGCRYVESSNIWSEGSTEGTRDTTASGVIFSSIFTGREGYGVAALASQGPTKPQVIICNTPDKTDPLNQLLTAGWKSMYQAFIVNKPWVAIVRSKSSYV